MSIENLVVGATGKTVTGLPLRIVCVDAKVADGYHNVLALIDNKTNKQGDAVEFLEWYDSTNGLDGDVLHAIVQREGYRDIDVLSLEAPCSNHNQ
ncbi:hypothetical protein NVP1244A_062 [Vibrio phage 1.244.A._10N.261.54.C3]|nr:hypothetical protein NVP1244A_062 [Vibrio phage 1.244.A._10N.261.54.C3]AUR98690.1 hypothetical protein NVP1255O_062 [Vibrio phage 1.255.O._10N.286.45.F1]